MAGTKEGGQRAAATNKSKYGSDFYARIGAKGGKIGVTGGFAAQVECNCDVVEGSHTIPQCAGRKGGIKSRRPPKEAADIERDMSIDF